ncbi:acyl-protein thioesterase 1 [Cryptococcus amylolentus CBS 6039]|uniref:Acyl-protein thioesterase 1 n=1 Tax=Cryptococcus amylolentus CBS 6039 TaxID=1295533 RepID=A0A1E3HF88_9TREE|nr:acyl-protein thioesterase 1 [Cryptococcus amylolentus CBS 6039]ODN74426.1 acyl-protein thioesterase 1 [Cryptococcus amylolentus CBS 6039]
MPSVLTASKFIGYLILALLLASLYLYSTPLKTTPTMAAPLKHLKIAPKEAHKATVIFLHGLGDSGQGWLPVAKMLWSSFPHVKWILPHAPPIPITLNQGMSMPGWFDLSNLSRLDDPAYDDETGMNKTLASVDALIQQEVDAGIPEDKIVLGGFSQGGVIAMLGGLTTKRKLGGIVGLSCWLPLSDRIEQLKSAHAHETSVFWGHGTNDPVVDYSYGQRSVGLLTQKLGYNLVPKGQTFARPGVRFESYPGMAHSSSPKEIEDLREWLAEALKE